MKRLLIISLVVLLMAGCSISKEKSAVFPEDEFFLIGHRGASAYVPENTLASFALAEDLGADYIELDIHETKDGKLVVMHDKDVSRTTEGHGNIETFTLDELKSLSIVERKKDKETVLGPSESMAVPTLQEVFDQFGDSLNYVVELKNPSRYPNIEKKLVQQLEENDLIQKDKKGRPRAVIHSFSEKALQRVHKINPDIPLLQLISFDEGEEAELSKKKITKLLSYADGIGVSYEALTPPFVNYMHEKGLAVFAYTVNDPEVALRLQAMGLNGIHTDKPDLVEREK
ncbi:glycerophosphodiester phosphodiesterase family protein [Sporosarcina sp. Te-1]|uniref:glycerophosphodiester phosphodiesterase n=1 Tax=Sporosarcina sp. Te-1 TaxID=2818390 RepID=UPI001A9DE881|nr:glycerophosphodiester phosphodiesterase family protein [Sporosarcina sp. Te-1]QTD41145.1 glycerophosphodiester phosphodiesterase [Sporosarcina sp. Te-1]